MKAVKIENKYRGYNEGWSHDLSSVFFTAYQNEWVNRLSADDNKAYVKAIIQPLINIYGCDVQTTQQQMSDTLSWHKLIITYETLMGKQEFTSAIMCTHELGEIDRGLLLRNLCKMLVDYIHEDVIESEGDVFECISEVPRNNSQEG